MAEQAKSAARPRPLSPHLQIYRWPVTMAGSIVHRATGIALAAGTIVLAWWLMAIASGPAAFDTFSDAARNPLGQLILFGFAWSLAYHLLNGLRHLAWDAGWGFDIRTANRSGILVFVFSLLIAIAVFAYAYAARGVRL
ncbi:MAG TPA: succinate dehydrogenase, cytochrome b556 subunit [Rhizomicrobium sp.]|jgi:succinate dehydrogenase / fumarate reductase cytochrome b subunit